MNARHTNSCRSGQVSFAASFAGEQQQPAGVTVAANTDPCLG